MWVALHAEISREFALGREEREAEYLEQLEKRRWRARQREKELLEEQAQALSCRFGQVKTSVETCLCGARVEHREGIPRPLHLDPETGRATACVKAA
jgi:hypothetical protein